MENCNLNIKLNKIQMCFIIIIMKKTILLILLLMFLSGCGLYNLSNFIMPDDIEFLALVEELNTPKKIGTYMEENFDYKVNPYVLTPYELWKIKEGDCDSFRDFGRFIANWHRYETYWIGIFYSDVTGKHCIAVYVEDNVYRYSITNGQTYFWGFDTFRQIVKVDSLLFHRTWRKYIVYDYYNNIVEQVYNI